jgi:hypothetical protein
VVRAYFDTNMIIAESKGKISHPYLQFLMSYKGVLPPDMIKGMHNDYKACEPS